jgi:protein ImuB
MRWVCLLLPQLALDGVLRRQPMPDQPLALIDGPVQRRVLHSVNPAARALGLRAGQSLAAAQAIHAGFTSVAYDAKDAAHWRDLVAAWAYRFSSQVSTQFSHAIVLEIGRSLKLFGPWPRLEAQMREELREMGFRHRLVAAPNPHAARVLANVHDGIGLTDESLLTGLGQIPVERAGLDRETAVSLSRMGLRRLSQVFELPRDSITRRFPKTVLPYLDALRGEMTQPLTLYRPPDVFDQRMEFDHEIESSQALLFPLRRLTADLATFLAGRDGGVQRFVLVLEHERCDDSEVTVGLLAPERAAATLFELTRGRLEQARVPAPVRGLRLIASELPPFVPASRDLFDARSQQAMPWPQLRERLRARLGDDAVHGLAIRGDHRPERAWGVEAPVQRETAPPSLPRPGWLLHQPIPLRDHALTVLAGPERIESGWWDGFEVRRDYYLVETSSGQRAWAYCVAGERGPYMLHGWFA